MYAEIQKYLTLIISNMCCGLGKPFDKVWLAPKVKKEKLAFHLNYNERHPTYIYNIIY